MSEGLKDYQLEKMNEIMIHIQKYRVAKIFADPVNTKEVPSYLDIIDEPMDFGTINKKIRENKYDSVQQWKNDVNLVWSNCKKFNQGNEIYFGIAEHLEREFKKACQFFTGDQKKDWVHEYKDIATQLRHRYNDYRNMNKGSDDKDRSSHSHSKETSYSRGSRSESDYELAREEFAFKHQQLQKQQRERDRVAQEERDREREKRDREQREKEHQRQESMETEQERNKLIQERQQLEAELQRMRNERQKFDSDRQKFEQERKKFESDRIRTEIPEFTHADRVKIYEGFSRLPPNLSEDAQILIADSEGITSDDVELDIDNLNGNTLKKLQEFLIGRGFYN